MEFNLLPNEGTINLEDIRHREFGDILQMPVTPNDEIQEFEFDYDQTLRFTDVRDIEELHFAFTKK